MCSAVAFQNVPHKARDSIPGPCQNNNTDPKWESWEIS